MISILVSHCVSLSPLFRSLALEEASCHVVSGHVGRPVWKALRPSANDYQTLWPCSTSDGCSPHCNLRGTLSQNHQTSKRFSGMPGPHTLGELHVCCF